MLQRHILSFCNGKIRATIQPDISLDSQSSSFIMKLEYIDKLTAYILAVREVRDLRRRRRVKGVSLSSKVQ
jgi:hypothetical protein